MALNDTNLQPFNAEAQPSAPEGCVDKSQPRRMWAPGEVMTTPSMDFATTDVRGPEVVMDGEEASFFG